MKNQSYISKTTTYQKNENYVRKNLNTIGIDNWYWQHYHTSNIF